MFGRVRGPYGDATTREIQRHEDRRRQKRAVRRLAVAGTWAKPSPYS
jgi:hypothetical protein